MNTQKPSQDPVLKPRRGIARPPRFYSGKRMVGSNSPPAKLLARICYRLLSELELQAGWHIEGYHKDYIYLSHPDKPFGQRIDLDSIIRLYLHSYSIKANGVEVLLDSIHNEEWRCRGNNILTTNLHGITWKWSDRRVVYELLNTLWRRRKLLYARDIESWGQDKWS